MMPGRVLLWGKGTDDAEWTYVTNYIMGTVGLVTGLLLLRLSQVYVHTDCSLFSLQVQNSHNSCQINQDLVNGITTLVWYFGLYGWSGSSLLSTHGCLSKHSHWLACFLGWRVLFEILFLIFGRNLLT